MYEDLAKKTPRYVLKGTTTVGVVCRDGIVLGTDTRATMGYFIAHKRAKKVYQIDDHLAMTIAGGVADAQNVVEIVKANSQLYKYEKSIVMPVKAAASLTSNLLFANRYFPLILQALLGGVDSSGPHIFALDPLGSVTEEKCVSTGSGSPVAYGVLENEFKDGMIVKDAVPIVVKAVNSAMKRDSASGDSFDVAIVTSKGYQELSEDEKKTILSGLS
jgi:proteasome beta subunit